MGRTRRDRAVGEPTERGAGRALLPALGLLAYLLLAVATTWPLAWDLGAGPPRGTERSATVPLFNLWTLAWNHDRLAQGYSGYWDAPIFWPERGSFALSEPQPLTGLLTAPVAWMTGSEVVAYNLFLLAALALNGLFGLLLLRAVGLRLWIAWAGGAAIVTLPFVHQELGVLQLVPLAGLLAFALALLRLSEAPGAGRGVLAGLALASTYLLCGYYGLFALAVVVPAALWYLVPALRDSARRRRLLTGLAVAAAVSAVTVAPVALGQLRAARSFELERSVASVERQSARASDYTRTPWREWLPLPGVELARHPGARAFFPGTVEVGLALGMMALFLVRPRRRSPVEAPGRGRHLAFFATLVLLGGWLSFGPRGGALSPYTLMHALLPGFSSLRSLFRLAVLVQVGVVGLAASGLDELMRPRRRHRGGRRARLAAGGILALLMIADPWPRTGPIQLLPPSDAEPAWLEWIRTHTAEDDVFVFFPFPEGGTARDYTVTAQWMYWQTAHWRPMVNGYSGHFPASFLELKRRLRGFPSPRGLDALAERGTRYCVVLRARTPPAAMDAVHTATHALRPVYRDPPGVLAVYEIVALRRADAGPTGTRDGPPGEQGRRSVRETRRTAPAQVPPPRPPAGARAAPGSAPRTSR